MSLKTQLMTVTISLCALLPAAPLMAQDAGKMDHSKMHGKMMPDGDMPGMAAPKGDQGPSSKAFSQANARMHKGMAITYTGKADVDFARGMIAHHQGAIDMAKVELEFGKDPDLRALAQEVIKAQETEITRMKDWLAKNGG
jgi:uncharacterized protein (DUF305 family)